MAHSDGEWAAVIGAIIIKWGAIEELVATSIHQIETEIAIASGTIPVVTDVGSLRDFKKRKGHLRKLFEQHAHRDELAKLDEIYQALIDARDTRHALSHDIVALQPMTGQLGITKHGHDRRGMPTKTTWKTFEELVATVRELDENRAALARLTIAIANRFATAGQMNPP